MVSILMKKLIIGATGSIGSAVSRNIQKNGGKTHLVGRNENELPLWQKSLAQLLLLQMF